MSDNVVRDGFSLASDHSLGGWDGYCAQVAISEGVNTVLTIDDDFERFDMFDTEIILSPAQYRDLSEFLKQ